METFASLYDVCNYIHSQMQYLSVNEIHKIKLTELVEFYVAAQKYIKQQTIDLAKQIGLIKTDDELEVFFLAEYQRGRYGCCTGMLPTRKFDDYAEYGNQYDRFRPEIVITLSALVHRNYNGILEVMLHELCHLKIREHTKKFYELELQLLQQTGLLPGNLKFDDVFKRNPYPSSCLVFHDSLNLSKSPYSYIPLELNRGESIIWHTEDEEQRQRFETTKSIDKKYNELIKHPIFDLRCKRLNYRRLSMKYIDIIKSMALKYNVSLESLPMH